MKPEEIQNHLRKCFFLNSASNEAIKELSSSITLINAETEYNIVKQGEQGSSLFIIINGSVRIHEGDLIIAVRKAGETFGEIGALASLPRTASVTAEVDSQLLELDKQTMFDTMLRHPKTACSIVEAICKRESVIINESIEQTIKAKITESELAIAQKIQRSFLPDKTPIIPSWSIAGYLKPAREVAGDFYDFIEIPDTDFLGLVIGDVCDKGVGAALFMTLFSSLIRSTSIDKNRTQDKPNFDEMENLVHQSIKLTNDYIATTHSKSSMFASVFFGVLNPHTGQLLYINAGHEAPIIVNTKGIASTLESTGPVIGLFTDIVHKVATATIQEDEMLFAYTDGATDAKNMSGEQFSEEKLLAIVAEKVQPAKQVIEKIVNKLYSFIGTTEQYDDITIIVASRK